MLVSLRPRFDNVFRRRISANCFILQYCKCKLAWWKDDQRFSDGSEIDRHWLGFRLCSIYIAMYFTFSIVIHPHLYSILSSRWSVHPFYYCLLQLHFPLLHLPFLKYLCFITSDLLVPIQHWVLPRETKLVSWTVITTRNLTIRNTFSMP